LLAINDEDMLFCDSHYCYSIIPLTYTTTRRFQNGNVARFFGKEAWADENRLQNSKSGSWDRTQDTHKMQ